MRWMTLCAMAVVCEIAGAQTDPVQAKIRVPDLASTVWVEPGEVSCNMYNNLGKLVTNAQGVSRVETGFQRKVAQGGAPSGPPRHSDEQCHGGTSSHAQTQRIAGQTQTGSGDLLIRLDATQLVTTMSKHHLVACEGAFKPETYRFVVFNGTPSKVTHVRIAKSLSFDLTAAELASGRLTLLASRNSSNRPFPAWVVAIRAIAANHPYESPQLVCTLKQ
jgi:hypothetical protein